MNEYSQYLILRIFLILQIVLYKIGCLAGGSGMIYLVNVSSWSMSFTYLTMIYVLTTAWAINLMPNSEDDFEEGDNTNFVFNYNCREKESPKKSTKKTKENPTKNENCCNKNKFSCQKISPSDTTNKGFVDILSEVINTPGTFWLCLFVLIYKMGENGVSNNFPLYLLDKGMAKDKINFWNGTVCQLLSIFGSFYGGFLISSDGKNIRKILTQNTLQRLMSVCFQYIIVVSWDSYYSIDECCENHLHLASIFSMCWLSFTSGILSTVTFTLMMRVSRVCKRESQSSHYSFLASVEVAGKLSFSIFAGFLVDFTGMNFAFAIFMILSAVPIIILINMPWKSYEGKQS